MMSKIKLKTSEGCRNHRSYTQDDSYNQLQFSKYDPADKYGSSAKTS